MKTMVQEEIIGKYFNNREYIDKIKRIAKSNGTVLITGETGAGKEILTRMIVSYSERKRKHFMAVNCGGLSESLLEATLFGHKKGAFTSAYTDQKGYFETVNGGTIFLDEISETSWNFQIKLLRVIEDGYIRRIGDNKEIPIDVRIIFATNKDLRKEIQKSNFRKDLYHRINIFELHIPPLRERAEDIKPLLLYYLKIFADKYQRPLLRFAPETLEILLSYCWEGNVRQLKNVVENLVVMVSTDTISPSDLPQSIIHNIGSHDCQLTSCLVSGIAEENEYLDLSYPIAKAHFEKQYWILLLERTEGNVAKMANISNVNRKSIYRKLEQFGINIGSFRKR